MNIKWLVFDAMGVIYTKSDDVKEWVTPFLKEKNPDVDLSDIQEVYHKAARGEMTSTEFFEHYGVENAAMAMYEYVRKYPQIDENFKDVAYRLSENYHIAMLSNDLDEWSRLEIRKFSLENLLEKTIISGRVKKAKPDKDIYIYAINTLDAMPEECLFIDDKERNLISARNLGFNVLRFNRNNEQIISNIDSIDSFLDLEDYLNSI